MEIKFIESEEVTEELILGDMEYLTESLIDLKNSIIALGDNDTDNEVYHKFCDTEDEVKNILDEIKIYFKQGETNQ